MRRSWDVAEARVIPTKSSKERIVPIAAVLRRPGTGSYSPATTRITSSNTPRRSYALGVGRVSAGSCAPAGVLMHGARHTVASFAIAAGVNVKALSTYMGHRVSITLDTYGHLLPGNEDEAAGLLDGYLSMTSHKARRIGSSANSDSTHEQRHPLNAYVLAGPRPPTQLR